MGKSSFLGYNAGDMTGSPAADILLIFAAMAAGGYMAAPAMAGAGAAGGAGGGAAAMGGGAGAMELGAGIGAMEAGGTTGFGGLGAGGVAGGGGLGYADAFAGPAYGSTDLAAPAWALEGGAEGGGLFGPYTASGPTSTTAVSGMPGWASEGAGPAINVAEPPTAAASPWYKTMGNPLTSEGFNKTLYNGMMLNMLSSSLFGGRGQQQALPASASAPQVGGRGGQYQSNAMQQLALLQAAQNARRRTPGLFG